MVWYSAGTVTATNGSASITGNGTSFLGNVRVGDGITIAGSTSIHEVTGVTSDTQLTIAPGYTGATGSGKAYRIAPIQGYDKDLADAFNQLRLQFGGQLSALQPWATAATTTEARTLLGSNNAANLTTGFLSADRIPSTLSPDKAFRRGNILGTVSQVEGVPTGAIIQSGSNANGWFVRYAGGMQECAGDLVVPVVAAQGDVEANIVYPIPFAATVHIVPCGLIRPFTSYDFVAKNTYFNNNGSGQTMVLARNGGTAQQFVLSWRAIGRWF